MASEEEKPKAWAGSTHIPTVIYVQIRQSRDLDSKESRLSEISPARLVHQ